MTTLGDDRPVWPELPWREWEPTISTLRLWVQIVGKVRMALTPPLNHWWHVPLYVTASGLTTSPIPYGRRQFQVDFDFIAHKLTVTDTEGQAFTMPLEPRSVARFYVEFMAGLRGLAIDVQIRPRPVEIADAIPFEDDEQHASYVPSHASSFWHGLLQADRVMKAFQSGFAGKVSPVQFFWGSFDLAAARYSGRPAPLHPGGAPNCGAWVMEEAYSREESSIGWWPGIDPPGPAFYAYTYPEPEGYATTPVRPAAASYDVQLGEFVLPYDDVRRSADPNAVALDFFASTYRAGADLAQWDRALLEPAVLPGRAPRRAWTTVNAADTAAKANRIHAHRARPR